MLFFESLYVLIDRLDSKKFILYVILIISGIVVVSGGLLIQQYRSVVHIKKRISAINNYRNQIKDILERGQEVVMQRSQVDQLLSEDKDFKIGGYFKEVLQKLQMANKENMETTQTIEREDAYFEQVLNAQFIEITMKELTTLLAEVENNKRIYTRELEIKQSEKMAGYIDVMLTIGTLLPTSTAA